jgi:hypothetical protein
LRCIAALVVVVSAICAGGATAAVAARSSVKQDLAAAKRALARDGYKKVHVTCSRKHTCRFSGTKKSVQCSGSIAVKDKARHRIEAKIGHPRCKAVRHRGHSPKAKPPGKPPTSTPTPPASTTPPTTPGQLSHPLYSFNTYVAPRTLTEQAEMGTTVSRLFVDWANIEPTQGQWDWTQTDSEYQQMVAAGLQPEIVVFTAPCWARPSTSCTDPSQTGPPDSQYDADWAQFLKDVVARYPEALAIEVWNEPNLNQYWLPLANAGRYEQILQEAYSAVKSVDPSMTVISAGMLLAPLVSEDTLLLGGEGDVEYLTTLFTLGAAKYMDGLGLHLYPSDYLGLTPETWDPNAMTTWIGNVQTVLGLEGIPNEPLYITEMGVSTATESNWPAAATPQQQATDLVDMVHIAQDTANVKLVTIHTLEDSTADPSDSDSAIDQGWGVFSSSGAPKPSACALAPVLGGTLTCSS